MFIVFWAREGWMLEVVGCLTDAVTTVERFGCTRYYWANEVVAFHMTTPDTSRV